MVIGGGWMSVFFNFYKMVVRGAYLNNQKSWGNHALFFTNIVCGLFLTLLISPACAFLSVLFFGSALPFFISVLPLSYCLKVFCDQKIANDDTFFPKLKSMNSDQIKKEVFYSDLIVMSSVIASSLITVEILIQAMNIGNS
jgi:hypothetical protein